MVKLEMYKKQNASRMKEPQWEHSVKRLTKYICTDSIDTG